MPSNVTKRPSQSTPVSPYVNDTSFDVGTTTIRFGASRYGPFAPFTFQFGKYDVLISTGLPISETWNEIESTSVFTLLTAVGAIDFGTYVPSWLESMRCQLLGPDCAYAVLILSRSVHHGAAVHSQPESCGSGEDVSLYLVSQHFE